ncbi:MAG: hypothetical protein ACI4PK_02385 [Oscillospiraceae bacterium]
MPKANAINSNAFAEASAFGGNTPYSLDENKIAQKVYFGKNGTDSQGWYITGYQASGYGEGGDMKEHLFCCVPQTSRWYQSRYFLHPRIMIVVIP